MKAHKPLPRLKENEREYHVEIGLRLRQARTAVGLSQENIGELLGVTFQQIQKYEKGLNRIAPFRLLAWSKATGVSVPYLFGDECISADSTLRTKKIDLSFVRELQKMRPNMQKKMLGIMKAINGEDDE